MVMRTILIASFHGQISRNVLQTRIIPVLREKNIRIVIVCHTGQKEYIEKLMPRDNVHVVAVEVPARAMDNPFKMVSMGLTTNYNLFMRTIWAQGAYLKVLCMQAVYYCSFGGRLFFLKQLFRRSARTFLATDAFDAVFKEFSPDVVFAGDLFNEDDQKLIEAAMCHHLYSIGSIRSWDNVSTRGVLWAVPNKIICHNEIIRDELMEYDHISRDRVFVSGIPHQDRLREPAGMTREAFLESMGLDPAKKTIMLAPGGQMQYKCDGEILKMFKRLKDSNAFAYPVQFLIREQPHDVMRLNGFDPSSDPAFAVDTPGLALSGKKKQSEIPKEDDDALRHSLMYCDVIMTLVSTIALDATYYDRPVVIIGFDPAPNLPDTPRKFGKYKHMRKLFGWGLLSIARSEQEFVEMVNAYLKNPALNHDKRVALAEKYAYKLDGKSGERVGHYLAVHVEGLHRRP